LIQSFPQKGFVDGTPITKGVRCVVNNESLLHTMHILLIIDLVMANTHPKSRLTKRSVVGLSGKKNGKSEEVKTPGKKKLKVLPIGVGIVTCSPPNVMPKFHCSNKSKTLFSQSANNVMSSIAKSLAFMGKHKVQCSHNPNLMKKTKTQLSTTGAVTKVSIVKSSMKIMQNETDTKTKLQKKQKQMKGSAAAISTKVSGEKLTLGKLNAYAIDWTDSIVTTLEPMKYSKSNNIEQTQQSMITILASSFKLVDIKVDFAALIDKVGSSAQTAFSLLPSQRAKLVESFLKLVFNRITLIRIQAGTKNSCSVAFLR
jgi:hypothetical protein